MSVVIIILLYLGGPKGSTLEVANQVLHKWYQSDLLCTRPVENVKSHSSSMHANCQVVVQIGRKIIVPSVGPESGGFPKKTASRSVVGSFRFEKNEWLKGGCLLGYFSHRKHQNFSRLKPQHRSKVKKNIMLKFQGIWKPFGRFLIKYGRQKCRGSAQAAF
eukprot:Gb_34389 [translate_table: standard]